MKNPYSKKLTKRLARHLRALLDDANAGNAENRETSRWAKAERALQDFEKIKN
jgi:hypothetical protein